MFNFDCITKQDRRTWPKLVRNSWSSIQNSNSASRTTNALLNLINHEQDIDKIYLCAKDPNKIKYKLLVSKRESTWRLKYLNDPKAFIEYSNDMYDIYKNIEEYNPNKKHKT